MSFRDNCRKWPVLIVLAELALTAPAWGNAPAQRELQRNQHLRQQQQDEFQLRMQQHQRSVQTPPADPREQQAIRQLEIDQRQRQQELHYRQNVDVQPVLPSDDEGTRRAKAQIEQQRARQQSEQQLQRFDWEQQQAGPRKDETLP